MTNYDVIIVGGGPGGYVAAIRAAKDGKKTALVEADLLGGTCLNRGCIPSKTLLKHAEIIEQIEKAQRWGVKTNILQFDWNEMIARKNDVMATLRVGIAGLLQAGKIDVYKGYGKIHSDKHVIIEEEDATTEISGLKVIVATGSRPTVPQINGLDKIAYHTTDTIFDIEKIPDSLVIVGGGVIGVEVANIFSALRTKVTIIELADRIIPTEDEAAAKVLLKSLKEKGVDVLTKHQVSDINFAETGSDTKSIQVLSENGDKLTLMTDDVLIAVGRTPNVDAVAALDIEMNGRFIKVNDYLETSVNGIFAVGDVIDNLQLAHVASSEGLTAVANLDGQSVKMDYRVIPRCIYTSPQIASVGLSEAELKEIGINYRAHSFNFSSNGMALAAGESTGFSKVMIDKKYGEILGVVMVGAHVTEMISQSTAYMYLEGTVDELAQMVQPHPSLSEAVMESANSLINKGLHSM